ncbi:hypothetical protein H257_04336, partial [Aphanomyces astaci]
MTSLQGAASMARAPQPLSITPGDVHILNELLHSPVARRHHQHHPLHLIAQTPVRPSLPVTPDLVVAPPKFAHVPPYRQLVNSNNSADDWAPHTEDRVLQSDTQDNSSQAPHYVYPLRTPTHDCVQPTTMSSDRAFFHHINNHSAQFQCSQEHPWIYESQSTRNRSPAVYYDGQGELPRQVGGISRHAEFALPFALPHLRHHHTQLPEQCHRMYLPSSSLVSLPPQISAPTSHDDPDDMRKPPRTCKVSKCMKTIQRHGLCHKHGGVRRCINHGCMRKDRGEGYCVTHGGGKRCVVDGCGKVVRRGAFCLQHTAPTSPIVSSSAATQVA